MVTKRRTVLEVSKGRRRKYDAEFKREAVRLVVDGGRTQREVARNLGVNASQVRDWVKKYNEHGKDAFPGQGHLRPQDEEVRRLQKDLSRVTEERDILKKALAVFSRGPK